ncbi:N-alpha-acetyltransferase 30 [Malassezia pachydermatis]|uniref:Mak3 n-acetyltransferase n=1 Tax=Malassezia pachydermatis TaxID=77020 RepID=A0A0M8MNU2_9BASI|nr:mak3 n-acetyltransferase [Malassezia pachydermatis]KOS16246.1 mak3 n-acetyltransferase [Malassezia pachydermatis]
MAVETVQVGEQEEEALPDKIEIVPYKDESDMDDVIRLIEAELSEPYHIYTYRYFLHQWPHLSFLAWAHVNNERKAVGVIVNKLDRHLRGSRLWRGYIAMLSVDPQWRGRGIATRLVQAALEKMTQLGAAEVTLETEVTNTAALKLYENSGFMREKRLHRFYLNGNDAFRLLHPIKPPSGQAYPPPRRMDSIEEHIL